MRHLAFATVAVSLVCSVTSALEAQEPRVGLGSKMSAMSIAQGGGIRLLGMGGAVTATVDESNIRNGASLAFLGEPGDEPKEYFVGHLAVTEQDDGADYDYRVYSVGQAIPGKFGVVLRRVTLNSNRFPDTITIDMGGVPVPVNTVNRDEYRALLASFGIAVDERTAVGFTGALSDVGREVWAASNPPGLPPAGTPLGRLDGRGKGGVEIGVLHRVNERLNVGFVYSTWKETETRRFFVPSPASDTFEFRTTISKGGLAYRPDDATLIAFDWARLRYRDVTGGVTYTDERGYYGVERWVSPELALRAGSYGDAFTWGAGWQSGNWRVDYAFVGDLNKKSAESMFGPALATGSDSHFLAATTYF